MNIYAKNRQIYQALTALLISPYSRPPQHVQRMLMYQSCYIRCSNVAC